MLAKAASGKRELKVTACSSLATSRGRWHVASGRSSLQGLGATASSSSRRGAMARRRTLVLAHQLSVAPAMKEMGQRKDKWHYFHLLQYRNLRHGKLSNLLDVTGHADRNLTNHSYSKPSPGEAKISFGALGFWQSETEYCAKTGRPFCCQKWDFHRHRAYLKTVVHQQ